uniref:very short patch repair endonuclease n=1 Tax=Paraburkholderia terrae TaxID=311230 RepID=UPI00296AFE05|nr:very short patch repair endonuclease [Paraburkholderia terrae]MDW3662008.1 very short patch repair endonuclease [Paraburkholderia terrae]
MDKVDAETRSRIMSRIKSRDTKPEMAVRKGIFARGLRFRLHVGQLPGRPDLVFPKHHAIIQVHGCFWHGHQPCKLFKPPASNKAYWTPKIERNRMNDERSLCLLRERGWRVHIVWECSIRGQSAEALEVLLDDLADWVRHPR